MLQKLHKTEELRTFKGKNKTDNFLSSIEGNVLKAKINTFIGKYFENIATKLKVLEMTRFKI